MNQKMNTSVVYVHRENSNQLAEMRYARVSVKKMKRQKSQEIHQIDACARKGFISMEWTRAQRVLQERPKVLLGMTRVLIVQREKSQTIVEKPFAPRVPPQHFNRTRENHFVSNVLDKGPVRVGHRAMNVRRVSF